MKLTKEQAIDRANEALQSGNMKKIRKAVMFLIKNDYLNQMIYWNDEEGLVHHEGWNLWDEDYDIIKKYLSKFCGIKVDNNDYYYITNLDLHEFLLIFNNKYHNYLEGFIIYLTGKVEFVNNIRINVKDKIEKLKDFDLLFESFMQGDVIRNCFYLKFLGDNIIKKFIEYHHNEWNYFDRNDNEDKIEHKNILDRFNQELELRFVPEIDPISLQELCRIKIAKTLNECNIEPVSEDEIKEIIPENILGLTKHYYDYYHINRGNEIEPIINYHLQMMKNLIVF